MKRQIECKIGLVVMFKMDSGGGAPRVAVDLIKALNEFGYKVHFLSPWKLNYKKIEEIFEPIDVDREYNVSVLKSKFCVEKNFSRKLMKKEFIEMINNTDLILDIDGGVFHEYLSKNKKYIIWRISGVDGEKTKWETKNLKRYLKDVIKKILSQNNNTLSKNHKIYAVDDWTKMMLKEKWNLRAEELCLYPEIKTTHFFYNPKIKKNQAIILGRISPNKRIDESLLIFSKGAKNSNYKLIVMGGATPDSDNYIRYLKEIARREGIENKLEFIKDPSFETLKRIVQESKILIESQRDISLTMTSIECLASGVIVLVHKNGGTYKEVLDNGKYGIGFESIEEGGEKLQNIIKQLEEKKLNPKKFIQRAKFFSEEKFRERLKLILKENEI